jgi:hypothetical protein
MISTFHGRYLILSLTISSFGMMQCDLDRSWLNVTSD